MESQGSSANRGSLMRASTIMMVGSFLLSWIPVLGPLAAGVLGGREAGTPVRAVGVAVVPALLLGVFVGVMLAVFDLPVLGAVAGVGIAVVVIVQLAPLLVGAWIGGSMADGGPARAPR
jgi:hypothetical protein